MSLKLFLLAIFVEIVTARITINVEVNEDNHISITHSGVEVNLITDEDIEAFKIQDDVLYHAVRLHLGGRPKDVYLKSPTPWGDLYKTYRWEQVSKVLSIKSARVKSITKHPVVLLSQDAENVSNKTTKANTGISHTIENTLTTSWCKEKEITVSQEIQYEFNVGVSKVSGTTGFSFTNTWGVSEEKSKTETIGVTSAVETELQPGQAVTAVLSASAGFLEIEVVYKAALRGNLGVNFKRGHRGHHFWGPLIADVMETAGISNEITTKETIKFGFHVDASLKVYDKKTGLPV